MTAVAAVAGLAVVGLAVVVTFWAMSRRLVPLCLTREWPAGPQQHLRRVRGHGHAQQVSLAVPAAHLGQQGALLLGLDALGDDLDLARIQWH